MRDGNTIIARILALSEQKIYKKARSRSFECLSFEVYFAMNFSFVFLAVQLDRMVRCVTKVVFLGLTSHLKSSS